MTNNKLTFKNNPYIFTLDKLGSILYNTITFPRLLLPKQRCFHNILVIANGSMSEAVLALPAIDALIKYYPRRNIHVLTNTDNEFLFKGKQGIDSIKLINSSWHHDDMPFKEFWETYKESYNDIFHTKFDLAIDFSHDFRNILFYGNFGRVKRRIGSHENGFNFLLTDKVKYNNNVHAVINKLDLLQAINIPTNDPKVRKEPFLEISGVFMQKADEYLTSQEINPESKLLFLDFNGEKEQDWNKKVKFVNECSKKHTQLNILVSGVHEDAKFTGKNITILTEEIDKEALCGLIGKSEYVIGTNIDTLHLAGACDTNTISIFGNVDKTKLKVFNDDKQKHKICFSKKSLDKLKEGQKLIDFVTVKGVLSKIKLDKANKNSKSEKKPKKK